MSELEPEESGAGEEEGGEEESSAGSGRSRRYASAAGSRARTYASGGPSLSVGANKVQARKMVLASLAVVAFVSLYRDHKKTDAGQQGTFRVLWGVAVVGMFLSLLADFLPTIAGPFAVLVALGSFTHGGDQALAKVLAKITPSSSSSPPPGPGSSSSTVRTGPNTQTTTTTTPTTKTVVHATGP